MGKNFPILIDIGQGLSLITGFPMIDTWNTAHRPKQPRRGMFGFNLQTDSLEFFDGSAWFAAAMSEPSGA